ncbi:MAG: hypothetical protein CEN87_721 [Parcubacteria group bacterium Licking1014_1]|nr:MAG: hypothetical protein CEN87_721 [Parcubacteria group bacterium Licking1014_1]
MRLRSIIVILLFYFLGLIQNSFFVHFNISGAGPNFIFILFFLLVFFPARGGPALGWENILYSTIAGLFLDIFSDSYFGTSVVILLFIAFLEKKLFYLLKERKNKYSVVYFAPLFSIFLIIYHILSGMYFYLLDFSYINIGWFLLIKIIYSLVFAIPGFYIYKKITLSA